MRFSTISSLLISVILPVVVTAAPADPTSSALPAAPSGTPPKGKLLHQFIPVTKASVTATGPTQPFQLTTGNQYVLFLNGTDVPADRNATDTGKLAVVVTGNDPTTSKFTSDTFFKRINTFNVTANGSYVVNVKTINAPLFLAIGQHNSTDVIPPGNTTDTPAQR
ncbi:MAG: hypothetical protein M1838_003141 [Thelocarpon superellum]|nr:MAG: hypothetical protein M1838_003141 [Thelocarpon superellum]